MEQTSGEKPNGPASERLQEQTGVQGGKRILLQGDKLEKKVTTFLLLIAHLTRFFGRSMVRKLFRATERLANSNLARKGKRRRNDLLGFVPIDWEGEG